MADLTSKVIATNFQKLLNIDSNTAAITDGTGSNVDLRVSGSIYSSGSVFLGSGSHLRTDGGYLGISGIGITGSEANGIPMIKLQPKWNGEFIYGMGSTFAGQDNGTAFRLRNENGGAGTLELYSSGSNTTDQQMNQIVVHSFKDPNQGNVSYVNYTADSRSDAYFGIGTKTPTTQLHVSGTISASVVKAETGQFAGSTVYIGGVTMSEASGGGMRFSSGSDDTELGVFQGPGWFLLTASKADAPSKPLFSLSDDYNNTGQIMVSQWRFFEGDGLKGFKIGMAKSGSTNSPAGDFFIHNHFTANPVHPAKGTERTAPLYISHSTGHVSLGMFDVSDTNRLSVSGSIKTYGPKGHITASGNISASGYIMADTFKSTGNDVDGISFEDDLNITGNITMSGHGGLSWGGNISASGQLYSNIINAKTRVKAIGSSLEFAGDTLDFVDGNSTRYLFRGIDGGSFVAYHGGQKKFETAAGGINIEGNITASGDIWVSGSGDILLDEDQRIYFEEDKQTWIEANGANLFRIVADNSQMLLLDHETGNRAVFGNGTKVFIGNNNNALPTETLQVDGNISSSGAISTDSHITASGELDVSTIKNVSTTHITASGNISSSGGNLYGNHVSASGDLVLGSTGNVKCFNVFSTNVYELNNGGVKMADQGTTNYRNVLTKDTNNLISIGNLTNPLTIKGSGGVSFTGNITASLNISASGTAHTFGGDTTLGTTQLTNITASGGISASEAVFSNLPTSAAAAATGELYTQLGSELGLGSITGSIASTKFVLIK